MKKYLYYSSLLSVFTEAFVVRSVIDIKLFYFIALTNLILFGVMRRLFVNQWLILFYAFLLFSGITSFLLGSNMVRLFLSQFLGICVVSLFFFNFFTLFKDKLITIFSDYTTICFYISVLGILIFVFNLTKGNLLPVKSILLEPAHYATIVLPGFFYALKEKGLPRYMWKVILVSIVLSGSSLGILGLGLSIILIPNRIRLIKFAITAGVACFLFVVAYNNFEPLKLRADDSIDAIRERDLTGVNLSTFFLASNFFVAIESLERNLFLGSGLGSHQLSHDKYVYNIKGIQQFMEFITINASDGASFFIRIMSELGLLGIILLIFFLISNYVPYASDPPYPGTLHLISKAILLYFFCKLLREGHHFPPELYFFVFAYIFASKLRATDYLGVKDNEVVT